MKTKVYLIRHGDVDNPEKVEYMRLPGFGLSEKGKKQILELASALKTKKINRIYASPLLRTRQSAQILSKNLNTKKTPLRYSEEIIESNYTKWQGLKRTERPAREVEGYYKDPIKYSAMLGESLPCIQKRVVGKIFDIIEKHKGESIAIVMHAAPVIVARLFFEGRSLEETSKIFVKHASVTSIIFNNELKCVQVEYKEYVKADGWHR